MILLIEADPGLLERITIELQSEGANVASVSDMHAGVELALTQPVHLIVVGSNGNEHEEARVYRAIRDQSPNSGTPILVLGACCSDQAVVRALDSGADDYVSKSVGLQELTARVRALLRRPRAAGFQDRGLQNAMKHGEIEMDLARRRARVGGAEVRLTFKEFELLSTLVRRPGVVFSREALLAEGWNCLQFVSPRNVDAVVKRLRRKIDAAAGRGCIVTVRGVGYRLNDR